MRKGIVLAVVSATSVAVLAGCGTSTAASSGSGGAPKIGVILPDTATSTRWSTEDGPDLAAAFRSAGVDYDIENAQGDKQAFQKIADQMINSGVRVLIIVSLDSASGKAVLDEAKAHGVATIDYDRLTLGGSARYYVSFDNTQVGRLQGEGLSQCLSAVGAQRPMVAELNGAKSDYNATLFADGYDSILGPKYDNGTFAKGPNEWVPGWDNVQAGKIFARMLAQNPHIDGVLAANDGLAGAVITELRKVHRNGQVPVTGQDATVQGLQSILAGDQCMTVYKPVRLEADACARLAIDLAKGQQGQTDTTVHDPVGNRDVPAVLLSPEAIFKSNVRDVVNDGYVTKAELCGGSYAALCAKADIQ